MRIGEVDGHAELSGEGGVAGHLAALVRDERANQTGIDPAEGRRERVEGGIGVVATLEAGEPHHAGGPVEQGEDRRGVVGATD